MLISILIHSCKPKILGIQPYYLYFPIVEQHSLFNSVLGAQTEDDLTDYVQYIPPRMVCQFPIRWMEVEATRGAYNFPAQLDQNVQYCIGREKIIGTRTSPAWARLWSSYIGSPPQTQYYDEYANFIVATCQRYNLDGIEIWNEPDCRPSEAGEAMYWFGAWVGNSESHYQGGQRYGSFLNTIYPIIKSGCPTTKIIAGALIGNNTSLEFLRGAIDAGLQADAISFHQYIQLNGNMDAAFEFADSLRQIIQLPLILSETSVTSDTGTEEFRAFQASYLSYLLEHFGYYDIELILWYSFEHFWKYTSLLHYGQPTPAYDVFSGVLQ